MVTRVFGTCVLLHVMFDVTICEANLHTYAGDCHETKSAVVENHTNGKAWLNPLKGCKIFTGYHHGVFIGGKFICGRGNMEAG